MKRRRYLFFNYRSYSTVMALLLAPHASGRSKVKSDAVAKQRRSKQQHLFIIQWIHQVFKRTVNILLRKVHYFGSSVTCTPTLVLNILIIVHFCLFVRYCFYTIHLSLSLSLSLSHARARTHTHTHTHTHTQTPLPKLGSLNGNMRLKVIITLISCTL